MWLKLLIFIPLAILSNTMIPVPFEPILVAFALWQMKSALLFVITGTICAAIGSWIDLRVFQAVPQKSTTVSRPELYGFYLFTLLCAFFPVPFLFIRVALFKVRPPVIPYVLCVASGRLPRYWMIALIAQHSFSVI